MDLKRIKMKILKYLLIALSCSGALVSCEAEEMPFLQLKDTNVYFDNNTSNFDPQVPESASKFKVPVILAGIPGTFPVTVNIVVDTVGQANPAKEGVDYTIDSKTLVFEGGYGVGYVTIRPIDNTVRQATRTFDLIIESTTPVLKPNPSNRITISILDDEHPLEYLSGDYLVSAKDVVYTGQTIQFNVKITTDNEDDNAVYIENMPLYALPGTMGKVKMMVDPETGKCYVPTAQSAGTFTYEDASGDIGVYRCTSYTNPEDGKDYIQLDKENNIDVDYLDGGNRFRFNDWIGSFAISGSFSGNIFFVFEGMEITRIGGAALSVTNPPLLPTTHFLKEKNSIEKLRINYSKK